MFVVKIIFSNRCMCRYNTHKAVEITMAVVIKTVTTNEGENDV
jgi:hypothetical protein